MDISTTEFVGMIAGGLTTGSFVPQVIKTLKTKDVSGISLMMYIALCTGILLWLIYGMIHQQVSIILSNGITLLLALIVLYMKIRYGNQKL